MASTNIEPLTESKLVKAADRYIQRSNFIYGWIYNLIRTKSKTRFLRELRHKIYNHSFLTNTKTCFLPGW